MKGVNDLTKDTTGFRVSFDLSVLRPGPLWARVRRLRDGHEWTAPVFCQRGAPVLYSTMGGEGGNAELPPRTAIGAICDELRRLWDSGGEIRLALMAAGFTDGVRSPHKPGAQQESAEVLAVRIRRLLADRAKLSREQRSPWSNTEKKVLDRGRDRGVYEAGRLTERGAGLTQVVDDAKRAVRAVVASADSIGLDDLLVRLSAGIREAVAAAAIFDLEADRELRWELVRCTCGRCPPHLTLAPGPN